MPDPSPATLRAARAVTFANGLSLLYKGRPLTMAETAVLIELNSGTIQVETYPDTVTAHALGLRHRERLALVA